MSAATCLLLEGREVEQLQPSCVQVKGKGMMATHTYCPPAASSSSSSWGPRRLIGEQDPDPGLNPDSNPDLQQHVDPDTFLPLFSDQDPEVSSSAWPSSQPIHTRLSGGALWASLHPIHVTNRAAEAGGSMSMSMDGSPGKDGCGGRGRGAGRGVSDASATAATSGSSRPRTSACMNLHQIVGHIVSASAHSRSSAVARSTLLGEGRLADSVQVPPPDNSKNL